MAAMATILNDAQVAEARAWLNDCEWADVCPQDGFFDQLAPLYVERAITRYFDGGIAGFVVAVGQVA